MLAASWVLLWAYERHDLARERLHPLQHGGEAQHDAIDADLSVAAQALREKLGRADEARAKRIDHAVARSCLAFGRIRQLLGFLLGVTADQLRVGRLAQPAT